MTAAPALRAKRAGKRRAGWGVWLARVALAAVLIPLLYVAVLRFVPVPGTILMAQRALDGASIRRDHVALRDISPSLVRAVIASEDARFCSHPGFDFPAIERALKHNKAGKRLRGGSTISQQTAKNVFLWPQRSWLRKGMEAGFTILIEPFWGKRRIMEHYLNVAEWGDGVFGAQAAARVHFGKDAKDLTPLEAARLAAVLPSPRRWDPANPNRRVARRTAGIQRGMRLVRQAGLDACVLGR